MSYVAGKLFYGFELSEEYIEGLLADIPEDEWGYKPNTSRNCNEIYAKIEELLGDGLSVKLCSHGTQDGLLFGICTNDFFAHAGESQKIDMVGSLPSAKELDDLKEAAKRLDFEFKATKLGWYLGAFWD